MLKYVLRRLVQMIPVIIGATFLLYLLVFALPGEPWEGRCGERDCTPAYIENFKREYNLDRPLLVQYALYLAKLLQGDLGVNFYHNTVASELAVRYPTTMKLALIALLFEAVVGIAAGVLAGIRKGRFIDSLVTVSTLVVISIPVFVIGGMAQFGILKAGLNQVIPVTASQGTLQQLILPGLVLGSLSVAYVARLTRTNLVENLRADYVRTARAKGLSQSRTIGVHALRNSLIPVITFMGYDFGALMGGAIVTERIFNINGIGGFIFRSINQRDGISVVGAVTCLVLVYLLMNLIVDILYSVLDPRISHD
ncbi:oligopeptide transport system permease protein [Luteococcus japonicus]|uniref:Oligopeptide transport system permease protein n=1 Tax=Luteococcus japonicus TaxID=33984 RepID=A0A3N1ZSP2_9ACTN|nr:MULTISPECIES: ABC transporter permease [Luteococcus]MDN5563485.1 ABC transporter permease [Luteococcus sp.]ROR53890.1 oligopeptide transport system permease protein [Luteococcus japonicus]